MGNTYENGPRVSVVALLGAVACFAMQACVVDWPAHGKDSPPSTGSGDEDVEEDGAEQHGAEGDGAEEDGGSVEVDAGAPGDDEPDDGPRVVGTIASLGGRRSDGEVAISDEGFEAVRSCSSDMTICVTGELSP